MEKMSSEDGDRYHHRHHYSDTDVLGSEKVPHSGPLSGPLNKKVAAGKKTAHFNIPDSSSSNDDRYVEITLDVTADSVAVQSVKAANGGDLQEDPELSLLAKGLEKKSKVVRNASAKIRQVGHELKRLTSFSKKPARFDRTKSAAAHALMGLKFISKNECGHGWEAVEKRFDDITASNNGVLPRYRFGECIGMESKEFALQLFDALARKRNIHGDAIDKAHLKEFWDQISNQSFDARLQTFFDMVDKDADGRITEQEVKEIISLSASANRLSNIQKQAEEYAALIMEELDPDRLGYIMINNLEMLLLQAPNQSVRGESRKLSQMLSQKLKPTYDVMCGLFAYKYIEYQRREDVFKVLGNCVCFAKGAAETIKLNMALILLPVCRNTLTWLRNKTKLGVVVPFDDNLNFHKVIAVGVAFGVAIHGIAHLACDFPRLLHATPDEYVPMEQYFGEQAKSYWHFVEHVEGITGVLMVILMAIAFTLAAPCFRRGRINLPKHLKKLSGFNAFWYSHHLFVIVYTLLIVHGIKLFLTKKWYKKTTWMYLAVPIILYSCERLTRLLRSSIKAVTIQKVAVYPGNVLALQMSRPHGFRYKSGQYMFVNCAAVSPFEWHPFSITSAPGDDYLSVHIRTLGDWTRQLRTVFSEVCQQPTNGKSGLLRADCVHGTNIPDFPRVLIDGPYGAPAQDYKKYEVVLLVGLGIGATPMISIVKDIVNNIRAMEEEEEEEKSCGIDEGNGVNKTNSTSPNSKRKENFKTRRAYFYWVTREQGSFDWFKGIMNEVAEMDHNHVIELHNYCTSVYEEGDARSALITMLQSLNHAKNGVDIVSGTRVKSHFAKPNWRSVYKHIAVNHNNSRVGVFYCGAPALTKELRQLASDFSHKTSTKFDFHKENF
uniref:FAD-binding FR-type domain-containing protein n=1 Tax=Gossypium raimondii TaxID=29730 RepID=A0A0D2PYX2_GOSRA|nr:hypothetical protein B456_008G212100 [Gossypium raimondii]